MAEQITTKPFVSQAQQRFAFGTGQPWAKRWARETNFAKLPKRVKRKAVRAKSYTLAEFTAIALKDDSDPAAVARAAVYTPELATLKATQIAPGVSRIRGDLCNVHGRWGSCRAAGYGGPPLPSKRVAPKKLPAGAKPKAGGKKAGARRPIKTAAQQAQERQAKRAADLQAKQQEQAQNRTDTLAKLRNQPNAAAMDAMARLEKGEAIDPDMAKALADETGLVELHTDGSATLSATGRAFLHALDRGDAAAAADAQGRAQDRMARTEDRAQAAEGRKHAAEARRAAAEAKRAEAERKRAERLAKRGGGGKDKKPPTPRQPRALLPRSSAPPRIVGGGGGGSSPRPPQPKKNGPAPKPELAQPLIDAAQALSDGKPIDQTTEDMLVRNGLSRRVRGVLVLTAAGQRVTKKAARRNQSEGTDIPTEKSLSPSLSDHRTPYTAPQWAQRRSTGSERQYLEVVKSHHPLHVGQTTKNERSRIVSSVISISAILPPSFAVFKDASGAYRWIARTTTAFEDRDKEVISTKALAADCIRADADRLYGPLRWWHVGRPDPVSASAPWGAGIDLGQCDFNAVSGRTLVESGTFKTEAIARAVAAHAPDLELSPGFFHAVGEPDASGVFHHIRRFERSLVPKWAGRASNPYTGLVVEKTMDQKKIEALKTLGVPEATVKELIADVERTEKDAESSGVRYKEGSGGLRDFFSALLRGEQVAAKEEAATAEEVAAPVVEPPATDPLASLKEELAALRAEIAELKEAPVAIETQADDEPMMEEQDAAVGDGGLTLSSGDLAAIGQMFGAALEPLVGALGITQKLDGHMTELKTLMGGYVKQKEATDTERANTVAALKATIDQQQAAITESQTKLAELMGDQPRAASYRPSQATDNGAEQLLTAIKGGPPEGGPSGPFDDLITNLFPGLAQGGTS